MMIISSGDVMCASVVMRAGLKRNMSIHAIVELFKKAADKLYTAKSFTEQEMGLGLLFLHLRGARLAGIAHQALGLPAVHTLQYAHPKQSLLVSSHLPTTLELEENISVSLNAGLFNKESSTVADALSKPSAYVLMFDVIKLEVILDYSVAGIRIFGGCPSHSHGFRLRYS